MKKKIVVTGFIIVIVLLLLYGAYKLMNARNYQLFTELTNKVDTNQKVVALTFDDGPSKNTDQILQLLDTYNAKGSFFLIGKDMEENLQEAKKIAEAGHQIGNHTYSHNRMVFKSPSYIKKEVEKTDELIRKAGYTGQIDVRPPNGKKLVGFPYYLNKHNRDTVTWNIEPDTYYSSAADKINYVKNTVTPGSIILMHPMYDDSGKELKAIEGVMQALTDEGYKLVTVNELQKLQAK